MICSPPFLSKTNSDFSPESFLPGGNGGNLTAGNDLLFWAKANLEPTAVGNRTNITDFSGNNRNFENPTFGERPTLREFSPGGDKYLEFTGIESVVPAANFIGGEFTIAGTVGGTGTFFSNRRGTNDVLALSNGSLIEAADSNGLAIAPGPPLPTTKYSFILQLANGKQALSINGVNTETSDSITLRLADNSTSPVIGANNLSGSLADFFSGNLEELLIFNGSFSSRLRLLTEAYLAAENDTTLPVNHPFAPDGGNPSVNDNPQEPVNATVITVQTPIILLSGETVFDLNATTTAADARWLQVRGEPAVIADDAAAVTTGTRSSSVEDSVKIFRFFSGGKFADVLVASQLIDQVRVGLAYFVDPISFKPTNIRFLRTSATEGFVRWNAPTNSVQLSNYEVQRYVNGAWIVEATPDVNTLNFVGTVGESYRAVAIHRFGRYTSFSVYAGDSDILEPFRVGLGYFAGGTTFVRNLVLLEPPTQLNESVRAGLAYFAGGSYTRDIVDLERTAPVSDNLRAGLGYFASKATFTRTITIVEPI